MLLNYGTISLPEVLWSLGALIGAWFCFRNYREAMLDREALNQTGENVFVDDLAKGQVRAERGRVAVQAIFLSIGLIAMVYPTGTVNGRPSAGAWFAMVGFIAAEVVLVTESIMATHDRKRQLAMIRQHGTSEAIALQREAARLGISQAQARSELAVAAEEARRRILVAAEKAAAQLESLSFEHLEDIADDDEVAVRRETDGDGE